MGARARNAFTIGLGAVLVYAVGTSVTGNRFFPAAVFALGAAYLLFWALQNGSLQWTLALAPVAAMAAWAWLPGSRAALLWTAYFILAFLATQLFASARLRFWFVQSAIVFAVAYAGAAIVQRLVLHVNVDHPFVTIANRNHFSAWMELLLPLACWEFARSRKPAYAAAVGTMFLAVVISASRTGIVLTSIELFIVTAAGVRRFRTMSWMPLVGTVALVALLAAGAGTTAWERFAGLSYDATTSTRGLTARASLAMIRERPLFGFGLGTWASVYPRFAEIDTGFDLIHADDDWLEWGAEGGLPFIGFVLWIAVLAVRNAWREPWSIGVVAVLIHSFTEFPLQKPAVMSWFVVLLATSAIARRQHSS